MTQRRIDPTLYVQAADAFDAVASSSDTVGSSARSTMNGYANMAGEDPGGEQFASGYDESAGAALQAIFDIGIRANSLDRLFMASGANAASAEAYAAGTAFDAGAFPLRDPRSPMSIAGPASAFGGNAGQPHGWEIVTDFVGMMWPNADTDQLDAAGEAWIRIADDVSNLATSIRQGDDSLASLNSAELVAARTQVNDFASDVTEFAGMLRDLGGECSTYAQDVRDAHQEVIDMLLQLAVEIAATVAISAALSVFTFGGAAAVGAGAVAARVMMIAARIGTILMRVLGTAGRVAVRIRAIRAALIPFATRFRTPVTAAINIVSGTLAAGGAELAIQRGDANMLVAFASGFVGGSVTEAIVAPFGRYGSHVAVQMLAGGGGGAASAVSGSVISGDDIDIRQVILSTAGGTAFGGVSSIRSGSGRSAANSAADPGAINVNIDGDGAPVVVGGDTTAAQSEGGRTGSNDYEGPTVTGAEDSGSASVDGGRTGSTDYDGPNVTGAEDTGGSTSEPGNVQVPQNEAPENPQIDVTPPTPIDNGGQNTGNDTPLFHDTETDLGFDADGDGNIGAPANTGGTTPVRPDEMDTPLFHETEAETGFDADGDGFTGRPPVSTGAGDAPVAPVRADDVDADPAPVRTDDADADPAPVRTDDADADPAPVRTEDEAPAAPIREDGTEPAAPAGEAADAADDVPVVADPAPETAPAGDADPVVADPGTPPADAGDAGAAGDSSAVPPVQTVPDTMPHPLLDQAYPPLDAPETRADAVENVNSAGYNADNGRFGNNCHFVVNALELRMRGYEVVASPTVGTSYFESPTGQWRDSFEARWTFAIESDWRQTDGSLRFFDNLSATGANSPMEALEAYTASWPVGGRGFIGGSWFDGGGHIFTVVREADGIRLYDGQVNRIDASGYLDDMHFAGTRGPDDPPFDIYVMRVDDLVPTQSVLDTSVPASADQLDRISGSPANVPLADRHPDAVPAEVRANERWRARNEELISWREAWLADPRITDAQRAGLADEIRILQDQNNRLLEGQRRLEFEAQTGNRPMSEPFASDLDDTIPRPTRS